MMVGSYWYIATKGDWEYTSIYDHLYNRFERQICAAEGVDIDQVKQMEKYTERIEDQMSIFTGEKDQEVAEEQKEEV